MSKPKTKKPNKNVEAKINGLIERFKSGDLGPFVRTAMFQPPEDAPCHRWTFKNQLLAASQNEDLEIDNRTYNQWLEVGRQVTQKGASYILGPLFVKMKDKSGKEIMGDDGKPKMKMVGVRHIPVFPASMTEGDPIPEPTPRKLPPLIEIARHLGIEPKYKAIAGVGGFIKSDGSKMVLGSDDERVFFHELAHLIETRIVEGGLKDGQVEEQEIVAELSAYVLAEIYGSGGYAKNAWDYISFYAKDPLDAIKQSAERVGEVVNFIENLAENGVLSES